MNDHKTQMPKVEPWMEAAIKEIQETWIDPPLMPSTEAWDDKEIVLFPSAIIARHAAPVMAEKDEEIARLKDYSDRRIGDMAAEHRAMKAENERLRKQLPDSREDYEEWRQRILNTPLP